MRLRLSKAAAKALTAARQIVEQGTGTTLAAYRFGAQAALDAGLIAASMSGQPAPISIEADAADGAALKFPLKARKLLDLQPEGPELGHLMDRLEDAWIGSDFQMSEAELFEMAKQRTKET